MTTGNRYIILLRGINVGGHNRVPMAELRSALSDVGLSEVATYIQSGNIVAEAGDRSEAEVVAIVETVMADRFGLSIPVIARSVDEWPAILGANPFPDAVSEPKLLHVSLCDRAPSPEALAAFDQMAYPPDQMAAVDRQLYLWYPNGSARSKLTVALLEKRLGVTTTARNWSTMVKLAEMISG